jgi:hypothetical protein
MENSNNLDKLSYQKPEITQLDVSEVVKFGAHGFGDGVGGFGS